MISKYEKRLNKWLIGLLLGGVAKKDKKKKAKASTQSNQMSNKVGSFLKDGVNQMKKDLKFE